MNTLKKLCCLFSIFISTAILHAQDSHWTAVDPHDYQYDMTVYATLQIGEEAITDYSKYEVAAWVDDEYAGVAEVRTQDAYTWLYLRVRSNVANGKVSFKFFDKTAQKEWKVVEKLSFSPSGMIGLPSAPQVLNAQLYTLGDVNNDGRINVADITGIRLFMGANANDNLSQEAADANEDGRINVADITKIRIFMSGN